MTAGGGPDGETLAVLAERIDRLSGDLADLARRVTTNEASVQGLHSNVAEAASLAHEVTRLSEAVAGSNGDGAESDMATARPRHPRRPPWQFMTPNQYRASAADLARWVTTVLFARYPYTIQVLPACWPVHPEAVEELDVLYWLWAEWAVPADDDAGARSRDAADWHDRWLPGVLARLGPHLGPCASKGTHTPGIASRVMPKERPERPGDWPELALIEETDVRRVPLPSGSAGDLRPGYGPRPAYPPGAGPGRPFP